MRAHLAYRGSSLDVLQTYVNLVGAVFDEATTLYRITPTQYASLQSLFFIIGDVRVLLSSWVRIQRSLLRYHFPDTI